MKFDLRKITFVLVLTFGILLTTAAVFASEVFNEGLRVTANQADIETTEGTTEVIAARIGTIINYAFGIIGVIFLTIILIGGFEWMTAGGNEEKVGKAKKWVINGINGMIVVFLAYALVYVILAALGQAIGVTDATTPPPAGTQ